MHGEIPPRDRAAELEWWRRGAAVSLDYVAGVDDRRVAPAPEAIAGLSAFDEQLPEDGTGAEETLRLLDAAGSPATVATTGPRYFGFVNGATYPVALASAWLAAAWDQNAALPVMSPVAAKIHDVVRGWLVDLLGLPEGTGAAFVTGATEANACGLTAARDALLARLGWDAPANGLFGAPEIPIVVGAHAHSTLRKSLGFVGLGRERVIAVPADDQGRMRPEFLPDIEGPVLVCAQAGEVNTGASDPFDAVADWVAERSGWLHVDGAFGLWALADPARAHLVAGLDRADSWATDAHKWLNVTYDCGIVLVRDPADLRRSFASVAGYLPGDVGFEAMHHTPQSSQRARAVEVWSVLRTLGRAGIAAMVATSCEAAAVIADRLRSGGLDILNDVVLNQVLIRMGDGPTTSALIAEIQRDGRIWCGPTQWQGATAMRISVSSWKTGRDDAERTAEVILECAAAVARRALT